MYEKKTYMLHYLAGEEGFEPSHAGIKIQCLNRLTTPQNWVLFGWGGRIRTFACWNQNPVS